MKKVPGNNGDYVKISFDVKVVNICLEYPELKKPQLREFLPSTAAIIKLLILSIVLTSNHQSFQWFSILDFTFASKVSASFSFCLTMIDSANLPNTGRGMLYSTSTLILVPSPSGM